MGRKSRDKGARAEREIVNLLRDLGVESRRVPLSGACRGFKDDIIVTMPPNLMAGERFEAKVRADDFKRLYGWIEDTYGLFIRRDRSPWLVVLRLEDFADLVKR